jgi:chemotaxis protein histidine kinase CheA
MSSSVGLLEFFILEASEYIEQLDGLVAAGGESGPNGEEFSRYARALRGSATMARQGALAELAGGVERVGRALRDGTLMWEAGVAGVLTSSVDDLKLLVRTVRTWGSPEEQRAQARIAELARWAPHSTRPYQPTPSFTSGSAFLVAECAAIADTLEAAVARPADRTALNTALARVRALRGVAALRDVPPIGDVVDAVERAAKPVELGSGAASRIQIEVFGTAAALMRRAASELRVGTAPDPSSAEAQRFAAAAAALDESGGEADRIVPIASMFFEDGQPDVVSVAPNPPTTPAERFRLEVVSQAEHLRRLAADARQAASPAGRDRLARELRGALRSLHAAAESFGENEVARWVAAQSDGVAALDPAALAALDDIATRLADPSTDRTELHRRLGEPTGAHTSGPSAQQALRGAPSRKPTPSGRQLHSLLEDGIVRLGELATTPLSEPVPIIDETLVPIEALLYRGRAALDRARELRDELRTRGGGPPDREALDELYDLLELATTE